MPTYPAEQTQTQRDLELSRLGPPTQSLRPLTDREVLLAGRRAKVAESKANAQRWLCFAEFYRRRLATEAARREASAHFALTARQETVVEIGSLWGMDASRVRKELNVALFLCEHGAAIWELCLAGQLDGYRATLIADAARQKIDRDEDVVRFMTRTLKFLRKHLTGVDGDPEAEPIVTCTVVQLRNAIDYAIRKLQPARADEEFRKAYDARTTYARDDVPGMGWLSINGRIDQVKLADHRLTLCAQTQARAGRRADDRPAQDRPRARPPDRQAGRRARAGVRAPDRQPHRPDPDPDGHRRRAGRALRRHRGAGAGREDDRARAGRHLAPDADRRGRPPGRALDAELPPHPVRSGSTSWPSTAPASGRGAMPPRPRCDLDHRVAWPLGPTDTENLWPGCRTDHRCKHAAGFAVEQAADGSYVLRTAAGFRHSIRPDDASVLRRLLLARPRAGRDSVHRH